jgi:hypothetical protein
MSFVISTFVVPAVYLAIGLVLLTLNRKYLLPRFAVFATVVSVVIAMLTLDWAASAQHFMFFSGVAAWPVVGAFIGMLWVQTNPWGPQSLLRGLAAGSGIVTFYSVLARDPIAMSVALLVTGALIWLSSHEGNRSGSAI